MKLLLFLLQKMPLVSLSFSSCQHRDNFRKTLQPRFRYTVHLNSTNIRQTMTDLIQRPRRLRKSPALRAMFEETTLSLNDTVLPIFVEEEIDDYKAVEAMHGVMRIQRNIWHAKLNASPTPVFVP